FMKPLIAPKSCNFKLEIAKNNHGVSSFGGIPLIRKALNEIGLVKKIQDTFYLKGYLKHGGYQDAQILEAVILLLASGGACFSDWKTLVDDPGFKKMFGTCMSVDVIERYLARLSVTFIDTKTEKGRVGRCGSVEFLHAELKNGCGLKRFPSGNFGVNAAWCSLGVLTHNVLRIIQRYVLPSQFKNVEIRTLYHRLIRSAIWVNHHVVRTFCY
ncbi:MAG: transposase, partial [Deltaproteobacteria bacterium]|nr:transposase [Deltaproteobacteria bacterium]